MKRLTRGLIILLFALANLALAGAPADAFRWKTAPCMSEDGEDIEMCCARCIFFCDECAGGLGGV